MRSHFAFKHRQQSNRDIDLDSRLAMSVDPEIVDRINDPEAHGGVCQAVTDIIARLRSVNLASERTMEPRALGMHPQNRSSYGCHED